MNEVTFTKELLIALSGALPVRVWRQNCGKIPVRSSNGQVVRVFDAGPPPGAADISGIVFPYGWRLEIEVKMAGGKLSDEQTQWAKKIAEWGGVYALVRWDENETLATNLGLAVDDVMRAIGQRRLHR